MTSTRMTPQELAELDLAVARVEGIDIHHGFIDDGWTGPDHNGKRHRAFKMYQPTRDAQEAMRLQVAYDLRVWPEGSPNARRWGAQAAFLPLKQALKSGSHGATPCEAICRCVVALGAINNTQASAARFPETGIMPTPAQGTPGIRSVRFDSALGQLTYEYEDAAGMVYRLY